MIECSFERLLKLLERRLAADAQLRLFDHLGRCEICREAAYHIARDRDEALDILLPRGLGRKSAALPGAVTKRAAVA